MIMLKRVGLGRFVPLGIALLAVVLVLTWGHGGARQVEADTPHAGLDFSMEVAGVAGCTTKGGDTKCDLPVDSTFTVNFDLNATDFDYQAFQVKALYEGVTSKDNEDANAWPDCVFEAIPGQPIPGEILVACAIGIGAPLSSYTGTVATVDFNCTAGESSGNVITLVHGTVDYTLLTDGQAAEHAENNPGVADETLTINCVPPTPTPTFTPTFTPTATPTPCLVDGVPCTPTPTPTSTAGPTATATVAAVGLPPTGAGGDGSDGVSTALWAVIGMLLVAAAAGLGVVGWRRYVRSR